MYLNHLNLFRLVLDTVPWAYLRDILAFVVCLTKIYYI